MRGTSRSWAVVATLLAMACVTDVRAQEPDGTRALAVHISIETRTLRVIAVSGDTLLEAPVAVGSGRTLRDGTRTWTFRTPVGDTRVTGKQKQPIWVPPDWYYIELARDRGLRLERLAPDAPFDLGDGRTLQVRDGQVGLVDRDSLFRTLPAGVDVILDRTVFIPPFGTAQRRIPGVLGPYRLLLGNGVGLHGTPYKDSIGQAVTHGCIRLHDEDITWLYEHVPVGSPVIIR